MIRVLALLLALLVISAPAYADYTVTTGSGTTVKSGTLSGGVLPWSNIVDANGDVLGTSTYPFAMGYYNSSTLTAVPGGSYGPYVDLSTSSQLYSVLNAGMGNWGSSYSSTGAALAVAGYDGTNMRPLSTTTTGAVLMDTGSSSELATLLQTAIPAGTNSIGTVVTTPTTGTFSSGGCAVATTATSCVSSGTYNHVTVMNLATNASNIACAWTSSPSLTSGNAVLLLPGAAFTWGPVTSGVPTSTALYCIGSQASGTINAYTEHN